MYWASNSPHNTVLVEKSLRHRIWIYIHWLWPVHTCNQQHGGHRTLTMHCGIKNTNKAWLAEAAQEILVSPEKKKKEKKNTQILPTFEEKKYGAIFATTAYWKSCTNNLSLEIILCLKRFIEVRTSWLVENHIIFLKWWEPQHYVSLCFSTLVLSYMLLWLLLRQLCYTCPI